MVQNAFTLISKNGVRSWWEIAGLCSPHSVAYLATLVFVGPAISTIAVAISATLDHTLNLAMGRTVPVDSLY